MRSETKKTLAKFIARVVYKEAEKNANSTCVFLHGQPNVPDCVKKLNRIDK